MHISPKQRRRSIRAHYLSQRGNSHAQIAERLSVSRATVRADLQLIETHWSAIAFAAADDLLLESLHLLQLRLTVAVQSDVFKSLNKHLAPVEFLRAYDAQQTQLNALAREMRRTVQEVHRRADQRTDQSELYEDDQQISDETSTELSISDNDEHTISSPQQEIVESEAPEENTPETPVQLPDPLDLDPLIAEAVAHFPHLQGQSAEQILTFLDQLTTPDAHDPQVPHPIYAEAAG